MSKARNNGAMAASVSQSSASPAAGDPAMVSEELKERGGAAAPPAEPEEDDALSVEGAQLRRKLDDLATQQRRSHLAVQQLADSVAALVSAHRARVKWLNLNSFVAYLIFTVLLGTAFYMMYARRAGAITSELRPMREQRDAALQRADAATRELEALRGRSLAAAEIAALYERGEADAARAKHATLGGALMPLEESALAAARRDAAKAAFDTAYQGGLAAFRAGNFAAAVEPLRAAVGSAEGAGDRLGSAHYYLGLALARTGELRPAVTALEAALAAAVELDDARYHLATTLDRAGELSRARVEYEKFATAHPKLGLAVFANRRAAILARWGKAAAPLPSLSPAVRSAAPRAPARATPAPAAPLPAAAAPAADAPSPGAP
ncbi:MAG: hypothetical protein R3B48_02895 [Kofleriaceae bacterium]